jgi:hypothetical protein
LRLTELGIFGDCVAFERRARSPLPVGRVDLTIEASRYGISENAFGPLTLAAVRLPEAEAAPAEFFFEPVAGSQ